MIYKRLTTHRFTPHFDEGRVKVSTEYQVKLCMAALVKQAEDDMKHCRYRGFIHQGQVRATGEKFRLQSGDEVDMQDISSTLERFKSGYFQRLCNALELNHRIDLHRIGVV